METMTEAAESDFWCLALFWHIIIVPRLKKDATYIFLPQQDIELYEGVVFPFALPDDDPDSMSIMDCVRVGCLGNPEAEDERLLLSNSTLSFTSEGDGTQEAKLQHEAPALTFPALYNLDPSAGRSRPLRVPEREVLTPDYTDFSIRLTIHEDGDLSDPLMVCVIMDGYMPLELRALRSRTEFDAHLDVCESHIDAIRDDSMVEPEDVNQVYRDSRITVVSVEGGNDPAVLKARLDNLSVNLRRANALGYQTADQEKRYKEAKDSFFSLQREYRRFYLDRDL